MTADFWPASEPLPSLLTDADLRRVFGLSESQFYVWKREGRFRHFEVKRPIGNRRYSGRLVEKHRAGESAAVLGGRRA